MSAFCALAKLAGLSHREAAVYLNASVHAVKSWSCGRNSCPDDVISELIALIQRQERVAREIAKANGQSVNLPIANDDTRHFGWPCRGAYQAMAARVIALSLS